MEDNTTNDDENNLPLSPKVSSKKIKLNDGSSQESYVDEATTSQTKEEVDSGVSVDKSESTSSEDQTAGRSEGPSNEVVNVAPSSSNVRAILLNIRRPKRGRNYRKRKTPDRDSDSNDSSRDSDDLSVEENGSGSRQADNSNSDAESEDIQRFMATFSSRSPTVSNSSGSSSDSNNSFESDDMIQMQSGDTDTDDEGLWSRENNDNNEPEENKKTPDVLLKTRPKHDFILLKEIISRETGLTCSLGRAIKNDVMFERKFYGSLHAVYRLENLHKLEKHRGCVNSINFHPEGKLLASGSDDTNIIIWDWARNKSIQTLKTGHKSNVFQSKFLHLNAKSQLNIVTCARDGQVRLLQCPPSGGAVSRRRLAAHARAAHKLHVSAKEPHIVLSCGEDGLVMQCDVRAEHAARLFQVKERGVTIALYSVCGHPLDSKELLVAGRDKFVRVYDRRKSSKPLALYTLSSINAAGCNTKQKVHLSMMHLTCAVYNHDGSEILGSYNDEDIYLFDSKNDIYDKDNTDSEKEGYTHRYTGHRNSATFKGVSFFGPKSQYIVSGSDCSYIYIWEKKSEAIVQWMQGDNAGVVNCIETHPRFPVMATSGLDKDVKIWIPKAKEDPIYKGIEKTVRENGESQLHSPLFNDFLPQIYSAWRGESRLFSDGGNSPSYGGNIEFDGNVCTAF